MSKLNLTFGLGGCDGVAFDDVAVALKIELAVPGVAVVVVTLTAGFDNELLACDDDVDFGDSLLLLLLLAFESSCFFHKFAVTPLDS